MLQSAIEQNSTLDRRSFLALLAKDWRFFRLPMFGLISVAIASYSLAIVAGLQDTATPGLGVWDNVLNTLWSATQLCILCTSLLAATFGGVAIAGERTDRTCDFMALLPVSRARIVLSKWIVSVVILLAAVVIHAVFWAIIFITLHRWHPQEYQTGFTDDYLEVAVYWLGLTFCFFGIAWLVGTMIKSGPISACAGIAGTLVAMLLIGISLNISRGGSRALLMAGLVILLIDAGSIVGGTAYYLRRVEP